MSSSFLPPSFPLAIWEGRESRRRDSASFVSRRPSARLWGGWQNPPRPELAVNKESPPKREGRIRPRPGLQTSVAPQSAAPFRLLLEPGEPRTLPAPLIYMSPINFKDTEGVSLVCGVARPAKAPVLSDTSILTVPGKCSAIF